MRGLALLALPLLMGAGCSAAGEAALHDAPDLPLHAGERAVLRSDLPAAEAGPFLARLETLELALDTAFPWLSPPPGPALTVALADPARYALAAEAHEVPTTSGAFVCDRGELTLRYRAEDWRPLEGPPYPLEPRVRPLAAGALRRRLLRALGPLQPSWLEEGLAQVFVEVAAGELGEPDQAARANWRRLLDAFLPLFLGEPPALERVACARGARALPRAGSHALAWAVVRYLLAEAELTPLVRVGLRQAAGQADAEVPWEEARGQLRAREGTFEGWLCAAAIEEALLAYQHEPTPVDRWEAAAVLRLVANIDLDAEAGEERRAQLVQGARELLRQHPAPSRLMQVFAQEVTQTRASRSRLQAQARLRQLVTRELTRRAQGYGHPAVERARQRVGRIVQEELDRGDG